MNSTSHLKWGNVWACVHVRRGEGSECGSGLRNFLEKKTNNLFINKELRFGSVPDSEIWINLPTPIQFRSPMKYTHTYTYTYTHTISQVQIYIFSCYVAMHMFYKKKRKRKDLVSNPFYQHKSIVYKYLQA